MAQARPTGPAIYRHCNSTKIQHILTWAFCISHTYLSVPCFITIISLFRVYNPSLTLSFSLIKWQGSVSYIWHVLALLAISCKLQVINSLLSPRTHLITSRNAPSWNTTSYFNCCPSWCGKLPPQTLLKTSQAFQAQKENHQRQEIKRVCRGTRVLCETLH